MPPSTLRPRRGALNEGPSRVEEEISDEEELPEGDLSHDNTAESGVDQDGDEVEDEEELPGND